MKAEKGQDFLRQVARERPGGFYAFCGPETFLKNEALRAMQGALGSGDTSSARYAVDTYRVGESRIQEISASVSQTGLFGGERLILVEGLERLTRLQKKSDRELWEQLVRGLPANPVILISHRPSRELARSAFLGRLLKAVRLVEFWHLYPRDAARWLIQSAARKKLTLRPDAAGLLVGHLGSDLNLLSQEIEKISLLHGDGELALEDLRRLTRSGMLGSSWECIEAILCGEIRQGLEQLQGVRREEASFSFQWKLASATRTALGGGPRGPAPHLRTQHRDPRTIKRELAQLLTGCYEWEHHIKGGRWNGRADYQALEGLLVGFWLASTDQR